MFFFVFIYIFFSFRLAARSICKVVGMRHLSNKRLGAALTWFLRSKVKHEYLILIVIKSRISMIKIISQLTKQLNKLQGVSYTAFSITNYIVIDNIKSGLVILFAIWNDLHKSISFVKIVGFSFQSCFYFCLLTVVITCRN